MRLSSLQRYVLLAALETGRARVPRKRFLRFYDDAKKEAKDDAASGDALTKSLERLIDKGLLVGYGRRTPRKWFIEEVRLMPSGRVLAKKLQGEQQQLPLT